MRGARPLTAGLGIPTCGGVPTPLRTRVRAGCKPNSAEPSRKAPCLHRAKSMTGRLPVTGLAASLFRSCIGIRSGESCARLPIRSGALAGQGGRGCGGSRRPRRIGHPPHQTDIIGEIAKWPILPILQTMFGGRFTAPLHPRTRDHGRRVYSQMRKGPGCGAGPPTSQGGREMPESFRTYRDVRLVSAKPLAARSPSLSPQEFFLELVPVGRGGCIKRIFECLKLRFFGLADFKSLIYCHIAVDHCR